MADQAMLQLGPDLAVPRDLITRTLAILSITGAGKSNAGAVIAEEMYAAGLPWVAIDPKGDWWGLRSDGDGNGPGLPVPIFGGLHGDLPLLPESGKLIADLIFDQNLTCILDVSEFDSKAAQMRFLTDFGERLFRRHGRNPQARHLILEEADEFLPQVVRAEMARCVGVWTKMVKQGRNRGLGVTIISQRSAVVNKDALSQCANLLALRTVGALDRKAILEWMRYHEMASEIVNSLPELNDGEAWMCSPQWLPKAGQQVAQRFTFRRRWTFDSGATPEVGEVRRPATLADINLAAVQASMTAVIEKAAQDDPAALRRKIADLERKLARRGSADPQDLADLRAGNDSLRAQLAEALNRPAERIEVPVLTPGDAAALEQSIAGLRDVAGSLELALSRASRPAPAPAPARPVPAPKAARLERRPITPAPVAAPEPAALAQVSAGERPALKETTRRVLAVLAGRHPLTVTRAQLAALAGMKRTGGAFQAHFSALKSGGYITERDGRIAVTPDGLAAAGVDAGEPEDIRDVWQRALKPGAWAMLSLLLDAYPGALSREALAESLSMAVRGGAFQGYLSTLRTNDLAVVDGEDVRAADAFFADDAALAYAPG